MGAIYPLGGRLVNMYLHAQALQQQGDVLGVLTAGDVSQRLKRHRPYSCRCSPFGKTERRRRASSASPRCEIVRVCSS